MVKTLKRYATIIVVSLLFVTAIVLIYKKLNPKKIPGNLVAATGTIDGDLINLNAKYPGRIKAIFVSDGQAIKKGQIIAILDSKEYQAQKERIESQIRMLSQQLKANIYKLEIAQQTIPNDTKKAQTNVSIAENNKKEIINKINQLELKIEQDKKDYNRYENLFKKGVIAKRELEIAKLTLDSDIESLHALEKELQTAIKTIENTQIMLQDSIAQQKTIDSLQSEIKALKEQINSYKASLKETESVLSEMTIKSPIDGYVVEKIANNGEVVSAGMTIATLIDPNSLYLKVFVDTINNGKIKLGDKAVIFLDAYPNHPIQARVIRIAQNAEFTPKEVSVRSDRIQRVYAVHLKPLKTDPLLKLGIPAIGVISIDSKGLPKSLNDIPPL